MSVRTLMLCYCADRELNDNTQLYAMTPQVSSRSVGSVTPQVGSAVARVRTPHSHCHRHCHCHPTATATATTTPTPTTTALSRSLSLPPPPCQFQEFIGLEKGSYSMIAGNGAGEPGDAPDGTPGCCKCCSKKPKARTVSEVALEAPSSGNRMVV
jgi:hypothetical protein